MKAPVDRAATERVLRDIDAVLRERTAAAVARVLATASTAHGPWPFPGAHFQSYEICRAAGVEPARFTYCYSDCPDGARCASRSIPRTNATPGLAAYFGATCPTRQAQLYAPWVVSPHLFAEVDR